MVSKSEVWYTKTLSIIKDEGIAMCVCAYQHVGWKKQTLHSAIFACISICSSRINLLALLYLLVHLCKISIANIYLYKLFSA